MFDEMPTTFCCCTLMLSWLSNREWLEVLLSASRLPVLLWCPPGLSWRFRGTSSPSPPGAHVRAPEPSQALAVQRAVLYSAASLCSPGSLGFHPAFHVFQPSLGGVACTSLLSRRFCGPSPAPWRGGVCPAAHVHVPEPTFGGAACGGVLGWLCGSFGASPASITWAKPRRHDVHRYARARRSGLVSMDYETF
jgi:hypothetical protein